MTAWIERIKLRLIKGLLWLPWLPAGQLHRLDEWIVETTGTVWLAIALCQIITRLFPFSPWGYHKLGIFYQQRHQSVAAMACFERAISANSAYLPAYYRAIELLPHRADLYQQLAVALTRQGQDTQAYVFAQLGQQLLSEPAISNLS